MADVAERAPRHDVFQVAGPAVESVADLARAWHTAQGRRALPLRVPVPGAVGRALRAGGLTTDSPDVRGTQSFAEWLEA